MSVFYEVSIVCCYLLCSILEICLRSITWTLINNEAFQTYLKASVRALCAQKIRYCVVSEVATLIIFPTLPSHTSSYSIPVHLSFVLDFPFLIANRGGACFVCMSLLFVLFLLYGILLRTLDELRKCFPSVYVPKSDDIKGTLPGRGSPIF